MKGIIYQIENKLNGKKYIGQTIRKWPIRKNEHIKFPDRSSAIDQAIKKYGPDNFKWTIIDESDNQGVLDSLERLHIAINESMKDDWGYNIRYGGNGRGKIHESTKQKLSEAHKGNKCYWYGKTFSKEHREKIGLAHKGKVLSIESRKKLSENHVGMKGQKHSIESRMKMSEALKGENHPLFGKHHSIEARRKMSNSHLGCPKGKYRGTHYKEKRIKPWFKVWSTNIRYNGKDKSLGLFNDPISGEIVYNFVFNEIHGGD